MGNIFNTFSYKKAHNCKKNAKIRTLAICGCPLFLHIVKKMQKEPLQYVAVHYSAYK
jgi:hypothetical protein